MEKQERSFVKWLNFVLTPPEMYFDARKQKGLFLFVSRFGRFAVFAYLLICNLVKFEPIVTVLQFSKTTSFCYLSCCSVFQQMPEYKKICL